MFNILFVAFNNNVIIINTEDYTKGKNIYIKEYINNKNINVLNIKKISNSGAWLTSFKAPIIEKAMDHNFWLLSVKYK